MLEGFLDDAAVEADQQQRAVGDLAGQLDRFRTRRRHHDRDAPLRGVAEAAGRAIEIHRLAGEQTAHGGDARAHLGQRRRLAADRARGRVAGADDELDAPRSQLLDGLDRAGQHRGVARERVGHGRKQRQPRGGGRRLAEHDERVARQHLAVEDPGAVEARRLDGPEQTHEVGHRRRAGDAQVDTDRLAHRASWYTHNAMSERLGQLLVDLPNQEPMR